MLHDAPHFECKGPLPQEVKQGAVDCQPAVDSPEQPPSDCARFLGAKRNRIMAIHRKREERQSAVLDSCSNHTNRSNFHRPRFDRRTLTVEREEFKPHLEELLELLPSRCDCAARGRLSSAIRSLSSKARRGLFGSAYGIWAAIRTEIDRTPCEQLFSTRSRSPPPRHDPGLSRYIPSASLKRGPVQLEELAGFRAVLFVPAKKNLTFGNNSASARHLAHGGSCASPASDPELK
jgi:hypothetical protein